MKFIKTALCTLVTAACFNAGVVAKDAPFDGSWESLQKMQTPSWFKDGKVGIFIHWGPYSVLGYRKGDKGYAEHVPKLIYEDKAHYYPYLKEKFGAHPPEFGYKDIIPMFKAQNWDPDAWAKLFADVGAKYVVFTAEHHDGWANWDSDLTPWNAMDKGPKRDLVGDLGKALRKQGLKYAPSYHRERHSSFFTTKKYVVNAKPREDILEEIKRNPEAASLYGPFGFSKEYIDDYVNRWKEIQTKYQPDMLWVDDIPIFTRDGNNSQSDPQVFRPVIQYFYDQSRGMITDFMNDAAAREQAVYVNNKGWNPNWPAGVGAYERDNLKLKTIGPSWQSCTTFGTSFGYLAAEEAPDYPYKNKIKTPNKVIDEMVEIISRNGNFLINIGPRADGTIPQWQVERLQAMGDWLKVNSEAIYGSKYWHITGQKEGHLAFTTQGKTLYAIKLDQGKETFVIKGTKGWGSEQIKSVSLLGSSENIKWNMTPAGLEITPPKNLGESDHAWSYKIVTDREQHPEYSRNKPKLDYSGTKDVDLDGHAK